MNEDFFAIDQFPISKFSTTKVDISDSGATITGKLNLRGVSKEITFPATIETAKNLTSVKAEFTINRQLWGVSYPGKPDNLIKDDVLIKLQANFGS